MVNIKASEAAFALGRVCSACRLFVRAFLNLKASKVSTRAFLHLKASKTSLAPPPRFLCVLSVPAVCRCGAGLGGPSTAAGGLPDLSSLPIGGICVCADRACLLSWQAGPLLHPIGAGSSGALGPSRPVAPLAAGCRRSLEPERMTSQGA